MNCFYYLTFYNLKFDILYYFLLTIKINQILKMSFTYKISDIPKNSWNDFFKSNKQILDNVWNEIENKSNDFGNALKIYPESVNVYKAFELCDYNNLKVVIVGQDCYHGPKQANGLCFSVNNDIPNPPSLKNILKEMVNDGINRTNPDFTELSKQGVLCLNAALTVFEKLPESMLDIWEQFTDSVIKHISDTKTNIVFILWGNFAKNKARFIDETIHFIIRGNHPSPLSANRGGFFNGNYFSKTNEYLQKNNISKIDWSL